MTGVQTCALPIYPVVLRSHQLDAGQDYFLLLTTSAGLYRYDIRDLVRVKGYLGQAPLIEFLNKGAHACSLAGEKLTEHQVVAAAAAVAGNLGIDLNTFALVPRWAEIPFYALHIERPAWPADRPARRLADAFDAALAAVNIEYRAKRRSRRLAPVGVNILPDNHLADLDKKTAQKRGRVEQFKHQYLYTHPGDDTGWPSLAWSHDKDRPDNPTHPYP